MEQTRHRIVIIGAGSAGICTAANLNKAGITDYQILEKGEGTGGTWYWNQYPGAECDVQSHLYSFAFEPKTDWSQPFAGQAEILAYLNHIVDKYEIRSHISYNTTVDTLKWQEDGSYWTITTADGEIIEAHPGIQHAGINPMISPENVWL